MLATTLFFQTLNHDQQVHLIMGALLMSMMNDCDNEDELPEIIHEMTLEEIQNRYRSAISNLEEIEEAGLADELLQRIEEAIITLQQKL